ncbi:protein transport protein Sec24A isoform X2 [Leptopilina boulardi]|uniref:protein transport protein Sec24A isoform X2 n=1 Tax=Leptopilina boulardi TaxID=63433 RepID=UPI0021F5F93D|nr:protein transport protein Sec24A isoform X2 [Leptopilina boulardi]
MSQLSNHPYPKNSDSDSVLKSGPPPPPVNGIGQPNNIQYSQNGIQSPHLAGTPSSQSSRDPSRETSRDPSPTQYLRGATHQSQYRPEWRPQMPPINGREIANFPTPQNTEIREANRVSPLQGPRNLPPHQSTGISNVAGGSVFKSMPNPVNLTENKIQQQKLEPASSFSQKSSSPSSFNSAFNDLRLNDNSPSESKQTQGQSLIPNNPGQVPISNPTQSQILNSSGQIPISNPPQSLINPGLVPISNPPQSQGPNNPGLIPISNPPQSQGPNNPGLIPISNSPQNQVPNNPGLIPISNPTQSQVPNIPGKIPISNPAQSQIPNPMQNQIPNLLQSSLNRTQSQVSPQNWNQATTPRQNLSNFPNSNLQGPTNILNQSRNIQTTQNQSHFQTQSNLQSQTNTIQNPTNLHQSQTNLQNPPNLHQSQTNYPKQQNLSSSNLVGNYKSNFDNQRNLSSGQQTNPRNVDNTNNQFDGKITANYFNTSQSGGGPMQNSQKLSNQTTIDQSLNRYPSGSQYGILSQPPIQQNIPKMTNFPTNVQNTIPTVTQNIPNAQQIVGGGNTTMPSNFYPQQSSNLPSQNNSKYPPSNYSYGNQLTNANLSGPPLMSQNAATVPGVQQTTRMPYPGMPPTATMPQQQNLQDTRPPYPRPMSNVPLDNMAKRYPTAYPDQLNQQNSQISGYGVTQTGFNKLWGNDTVDLLQCRNILPSDKVEPPKIKLHQDFLDQVNCSPDIFRCTLTKIPESNSLLQKSRLPLGVLIHPFKDLYHLAVIQCSTIVRCRACRTYINPFVYFVDSKRWKCNLCYRVNELPDEFQFDPATKSYGDPSRRPEVKTSTIEFIAPSEYMLRPPQPAVYLFVLDVSRLAVESGYLNVVCKTIEEELTKMPGDGRMQIGFIAIDSAIHFFSLADGVSQPHEMIMLDVEDVFLPCPENLIVNLKERGALVDMLLKQLPSKFEGTHDTQCALGAGLQAAYKLMSSTGGRVTVFQTCLPNVGPGALQSREDPSTRANKDVPNLNPVTDFYKRLALDCSSQQIAIDLFLLNSQYSDLATLSGMCKFSGGCIYHIPLFRISKSPSVETLDRTLRRYLTRKIGLEAVMRIRCSRGLSIHSFHGNFFVRSTDLLSLPNVNPDAGFGMQVSIDENLSDVQNISFQAALLYTSSKGERRIRVHTLCLPVTNSLTDILHSADSQCIVGLLSKMAVDRSLQSSLSDARDALINAAVDMLSAYKISQSSPTGGLLAPDNLKLLPLYIIALLKCVAFRSGMNTRVDDRIFAMCQLKTLPLSQLIQTIYPDLYAVHTLDDKQRVKDIDGRICPQPSRLHLSAERLDSRGVFLLDTGDKILIYVGKNINPTFCSNVFGVPDFTSLPEEMYELPEFSNPDSERLSSFVFSLQEEKPYYVSLQIIRDDSHFRTLFTERLVEDRFESALSYYEFLQHLKPQIK